MSLSVSTRHGTLLIVDAQPANDQAIPDALERHQFAVHLARTPESIIDHIAALQPDLVLLDAAVLSSQVVALCRELKQAQKHGFLPLLLLTEPVTGRRTRQIVEQIEQIVAETDADDVIFKPVRTAELVERIASLIRSKRRFDALQQHNQKLEAQLAERERALKKALHGTRELSILKDSIVNNVSHELRTPMLQVKSAVAMLYAETRATPELNGMTRLLEFATKATSRLESVIQNITQLATSLSLKSEAFHILDSVNLALRQLARSWSSSSQVHRVKLMIENVPPVLGDKQGVAQVLQQLIDNGLKFSPAGGPVETRAMPIEEGVLVSVHDYGIGVDEDEIERIFQEFYQVDHGTTRRFDGAGTGLAVVKLILDGMGVSIKVESRPGVGSTFSFVLPYATEI